MKKDFKVTAEYLRTHPNEIFVFGDNDHRVGKGGAAILRDEPNTYGFITKKAPTHNDCDYYRPVEYADIFMREMHRLRSMIANNPHKKFLISKVGAGLANRYSIWEEIIEPRLKKHLMEFSNIEFLF